MQAPYRSSASSHCGPKACKRRATSPGRRSTRLVRTSCAASEATAAVYSVLFVGTADPIGAENGASNTAEAVLEAELAALGCHVLARCTATEVVHEAARVAPEVVVCTTSGTAADALLDALAALHATAPRPVLVIGDDDDRAATLARALDAGVSGWAIGWHWDAAGSALATQRRRLASELRLAHARFARRFLRALSAGSPAQAQVSRPAGRRFRGGHISFGHSDAG